jgi:bacterioferritin-associated ferredoxin
MAKKRYTVQTGCPQCGCSRSSVLSEEEMKKQYGHVPNFDLECGECMEKFTAEMNTPCPEWDKECQMQD